MSIEKGRSRGIVGIFILIGVLFFIFMVFAFYTVMNLRDSSKISSGLNLQDNINAPIAVVEVEGIIMDSTETLKKLFLAEKNEKVKAIILRVNSPGGAVGPTQEIYEEIRRIDKVKPIYASLGTVAASGGYYIAAATRKIYANPGVLTGSIGVIMNFMDLSRLYEFAKVNPETIKAGKYKDIGSPSRHMTDEERGLLSEMTAEVHSQFINDIFAVRQDKIKGGMEGLKKYAQGQIYSGEGAKEVGLVDDLGGMWKLARDIFKELDNKEKFTPESVRMIQLKKDFSLKDFIGGIEQTVENFKFKVQNDYVPLLLFNP